MKRLALTTLAAAFAVAACDNTPADDTVNTDAAGSNATIEGGAETTAVVPGPTTTETAVVTTPGATTTTNADGDTVTVGPDGVTADVGDSDTRVRVETDGDPSVTVKKQ